MDYNATTPMEPDVIQVISEALHEAWGNPSSNYTTGVKYLLFGSKQKLYLIDNEKNSQNLFLNSFFFYYSLGNVVFPGVMAKAIINQSRQSVARMVGGKAEDIVFTSGGTEVTTVENHRLSLSDPL